MQEGNVPGAVRMYHKRPQLVLGIRDMGTKGYRNWDYRPCACVFVIRNQEWEESEAEVKEQEGNT